MKPTPDYQLNFSRDGLTTRAASRTTGPKTDFDFQANTVDQFKGHCGPACLASFRDISSDYFETEAPRASFREIALFVAIIMTVAMPLIHGATAVLQLIKSVGTL